MNWFYDVNTHLKFAGWILLSLGFSHTLLDQKLEWRRELSRLSPLNRQFFYVNAFYAAFVMVMMGTLCTFGTKGLTEPSFLGEWICGGLTLFWVTRLLIQLFGQPVEQWRGKQFETYLHMVVSSAAMYLVAVFGWAWWVQAVAAANPVR